MSTTSPVTEVYHRMAYDHVVVNDHVWKRTNCLLCEEDSFIPTLTQWLDQQESRIVTRKRNEEERARPMMENSLLDAWDNEWERQRGD